MINLHVDEFSSDLYLELLISSQWGGRDQFVLRGYPMEVRHTGDNGVILGYGTEEAAEAFHTANPIYQVD